MEKQVKNTFEKSETKRGGHGGSTSIVKQKVKVKTVRKKSGRQPLVSVENKSKSIRKGNINIRIVNGQADAQSKKIQEEVIPRIITVQAPSSDLSGIAALLKSFVPQKSPDEVLSRIGKSHDSLIDEMRKLKASSSKEEPEPVVKFEEEEVSKAPGLSMSDISAATVPASSVGVGDDRIPAYPDDIEDREYSKKEITGLGFALGSGADLIVRKEKARQSKGKTILEEVTTEEKIAKVTKDGQEYFFLVEGKGRSRKYKPIDFDRYRRLGNKFFVD